LALQILTHEKDDNKWKLNIIRHFSGGTLL
jgi:hypothetical protein